MSKIVGIVKKIKLNRGLVVVTNYTDSIVGIIKKTGPNGNTIIMAKRAEDRGESQMEVRERRK